MSHRALILSALALQVLLAACGGPAADMLDPADEQPEEPSAPIAELPLEDPEEPEQPAPEQPTPEEPAPEEPTPEEPAPEEPTPEEPTPEEPTPEEPAPEEPAPAQCGNNVAEEAELCDGADLGDLSCRSYGFAAGALTCGSQCQAVGKTQCDPLTFLPVASPGEALDVGGALTAGDPTWSRPNDACAPGNQTGYRFDAYAFVNPSSEPRRVTVSASFGSGDGFLHLFGVPFDPQTLAGCTLGNDDLGGIHSSGFSEVVLAPNQRLVVVVSTYSANALIDDYTLSVATLANVSEPPVVDPPVAEPPPAGAEPECGNGILETGEVCDGADLGQQSCSAMGYSFGIVACASSCNFLLTFCIGESDPGPGQDPGDPLPADPVDHEVVVAPIGETHQLVGAIDDDAPAFRRPDESCAAKSSGDYRYAVHAVKNEASQSRHLRLTGNWDADGFLAVYEEGFVPGAPASGCLVGDDDFSAQGSSTARFGSRVEDLVIFPGETLYVVATTFAPDTSLGDYSIDILTLDPGAPIAAATVTQGHNVLSAGDLHTTDPLFDEDARTRAFDAHYVRNPTTTSLDLDVLATWEEGDGMLYVYVYDEDAPDHLGQLIAENDDFSGTSASRIGPDELYILPGETLVVVATSYATGAHIGRYDLSITTP